MEILIGLICFICGFLLGAFQVLEYDKEKLKAGLEQFIDDSGSTAWRKKEANETPTPRPET